MARKERRTNMNEDFSGETEQLGKLVAVLGEIVKGGK